MKSTTNKKALGLHSEGSADSTSNVADSTGQTEAQSEPNLDIRKRKYSRRSTATDAQYDRIDRAFDYYGKLICTLDFRKMGVIHPSGRIKEMNEQMGYRIEAVALLTVTDDQGFAHPRIAFYEMIERPQEAQAAS